MCKGGFDAKLGCCTKTRIRLLRRGALRNGSQEDDAIISEASTDGVVYFVYSVYCDSTAVWTNDMHESFRM